MPKAGREIYKAIESAPVGRPTHKVRCTLFAAYPQRSVFQVDRMPLSSESNLPHYAYHECKWLPEFGTQVVYADLGASRGQKSWWLYIFREATEADLENGKADNVGEILERHQYAIRHCPFCGVELSGELPLELQQ